MLHWTTAACSLVVHRTAASISVSLYEGLFRCIRSISYWVLTDVHSLSDFSKLIYARWVRVDLSWSYTNVNINSLSQRVQGLVR